MKVLSGRVSCKHCGANLEYNYSDVEVDCARPEDWDSALRYITCPLCKHRIYF